MLIKHLTLQNLLSFGPNWGTLELRALNVVIGPNGSGKSNLLETIELLRNVPEQIGRPIRERGGIQSWLWKGGKGRSPACLDVSFDTWGQEGHARNNQYPHYVLKFTEEDYRFRIEEERINVQQAGFGPNERVFEYHYRGGVGQIQSYPDDKIVSVGNVDADRSILAQRRDPDRFPAITWLAEKLPTIRLFRDWTFGSDAAPRYPQKADLPTDFLEPDCRNLALVLNRLTEEPSVKSRFLLALQKLYDGIEDWFVRLEGGYVQVFFHERGMTIPSTRLSDGTLRYLCLLAILCHPKPPPLVCIEEPELGLHPDILPTIAELLREASGRTQLIVTTHSDVLVDCMTDTPEAIIVCEKHDGATRLQRLSAAELKPWLERYRLGELWSRGHIGGNRW